MNGKGGLAIHKSRKHGVESRQSPVEKMLAALEGHRESLSAKLATIEAQREQLSVELRQVETAYKALAGALEP